MNILIKRILIFILIPLTLFTLSSCTYYPKLDFKKETYYIYENEDKTIRFELTRIYQDYGKLYIKNDEELFVFQFRYRRVPRHIMAVTLEWGYSDYYGDLQNIFTPLISCRFSLAFEKIENKYLIFTGINKDIIHMKFKEDQDDFEDHFFANVDTTLYRVYDELPNPLSWFHNSFESKENSMKFMNSKYEDNALFAKNSMRGKINEESVIIYFTDENNKSNNEFKIKKADDPQELILSGTYKIDRDNIILINDGAYDEFPDEITLVFGKISYEEIYGS